MLAVWETLTLMLIDRQNVITKPAQFKSLQWQEIDVSATASSNEPTDSAKRNRIMTGLTTSAANFGQQVPKGDPLYAQRDKEFRHMKAENAARGIYKALQSIC